MKYGIYSLANTAIEAYLKTDFKASVPPSFLVQYLEAHAILILAIITGLLPGACLAKCDKAGRCLIVWKSGGR
ncbi:MAG: hypothetical protein R2865_02805 [Deinococcales bacterium]